MDAVVDIKSRLSIEDVISRYLELKRSGRNFKAISPFTNEKTASFMVSPEKQIWHDFSSGKGGNMFSFVMEMEGLDFKGALELLARQAGVDLSQYSNRADASDSQQKERLYEILELSTKFYQIHFSKNKKAYEYILKKRGINKQTALDFKIGYSPSSGSSLVTFLKSKGFSAQEIKRAGLSSQRGSTVNDMFRGRIMIPLMDLVGRVVGFTARQLENNSNLPSRQAGAPKYINTPASPLYDKSRHVFGLHLAKESIRKAKYSVVVEGNLDVISSHQAGARQVVATAGTAATAMQLKALGRFAEDVRLAFDQDEAGIKAAERSIGVATKAGVNLSIITISGAKDPDELIQKSPKQWLESIQKPKYALDWLISHYKKQIDINSAQGKREFSDIILAVVKTLPDSVEQDHYVKQIAKLIDISPEALRSKLGQQKTFSTPLKRIKTQPMIQAEDIDRIKAQNQLLAICLIMPETRPVLDVVIAEMLPETHAQKLLVTLKKHSSKNTLEISKLKDLSEYAKILILLYEETYQGLDALELHYEAARLQSRLVAKYVKIQKDIIASSLRETKGADATELLKKAKKLDVLLNSNKETIND